MWPFKSKLQKLQREDLVNSLCELERQERTIEAEVAQKQKEIDSLMEKGKTESNDDLKLFYAKKILALKQEKKNTTQRGMYILYNIQLLNKLKDAYDSQNFYKTQTKVPLTDLLSNQKALAKFLNKALNTRVASEDVLTSADELFGEIQDMYDKDENIYGMKAGEEELLNMFETEHQIEDEQILYKEKPNETPKQKDVAKKKAKLEE